MAEQGTPCSVVLEGGVTSAVLYASLLARLSRRFRFRQLGGASSGAVAAAAAAAAEFGRLHAPDRPTPFKLLRDFPSALAGKDMTSKTQLLRLFEPTDASKPTLDWALRMSDLPTQSKVLSILWHAWLASVLSHKSFATLIALVVLWMGWVNWAPLPPCCPSEALGQCATQVAGWIGLMALTLIVAVLAQLAWTAWRAVSALKKGNWGLCSGMGSDDALTKVLYRFLQGLSGMPADRPLTFGHLWTWPKNDPLAPPSPKIAARTRCIDLQIITTAVNTQRPVRLPGSPGTNPLKSCFYDPKEWQALFPASVTQWLEDHATKVDLVKDDGTPLLALPSPEHWPVILAVRLSLSFPILLAAVPMYIAVPRRDRLRGEGNPDLPAFEARKVYFSDGGITSNCPLDLFDAPLPGYPTFGVNLYRIPDGQKPRIVRSDQRDPELESASVADAAKWDSPLSFLAQIFYTALDWRDSLQRSQPGQRERIVHVGLPSSLGGLNLNMTPANICALAKLGLRAAHRLERDFHRMAPDGGANAWERHRWTRARTTLGAVHDYLWMLVDRLSTGEPDYVRLLRLNTSERPPFESDAQRAQTLELVEGLQALMQRVGPAQVVSQPVRPTPGPALKNSPPY